MKKTLVYGAATAVVALSLGSCAVTSCTQMSTLYGPPPMQDDDEPIEDVYGAPVDFDDDTTIDGAEPVEPEGDEGAIVTLYGPPTDMD